MYAIPALNTWASGNTGGWSNTSGGPSNGQVPDNTTDVIFDANSGSARTIAVTSAQCKTINTTGAAAMVFNGDITVFGLTCNLTGTASVNQLTLNASLGTYSTKTQLTAPGVMFTYLYTYTSVQFNTDIVVANKISFQAYDDGSSLHAVSIDANGTNVSTAGFDTFLTVGSTFNFGSGTWTFTGTGTLIGGDSGLGTFSSSPGCTIKLFNSSNTAKTLPLNRCVGTAGNTSLWIAATGNSTTQLTAGGGTTTFSSVVVDQGCVVQFQASATLSAGSFAFNGNSGNGITVRSTSAGTRATLTKTGGGNVYFDYCTIQDISCSPASTFVARSSTDLGNNVNITYFKIDSPNFLSFF
jgi:hypothetical protein